MPFPIAAAALLGTAASTGGNIISTSMTNKANRQLAEYGYAKDLEMWEKNNLYNSPEAQMGRLKTAGLNPNLVYGTGAVGNTSGQLPKYNAPKMEAPQIDLGTAPSLQLHQQTKTAEAQRDNINADTQVKIGELALKTAATANQNARTAFTEFETKKAKNLEQYSYNVAQANLEKLQNEVSFQKPQFNLTQEQIKAQIASTRAGKLLTDKQIDVIAQQLENYNNYGTQNAPSVFGVPVEPIRNGVNWVKKQIKSW